MNSRKDYRSQPSRLLTLAFILLLLLTACNEADAEFAAALALEWAEGKGLITVGNCTAPDDSDCTIEINYGRIAAERARQAAKRSPLTAWAVDDPDPELIAAIDIAEVGVTLEKADRLAAEGSESGDIGKIDQAIALRPGDWSYHDKKAAVLTAQGNLEEASQSFGEAQKLVNQRVEEGEGSCAALQHNLLKNREQALLQQLQKDPENEAILDALDQTQTLLFWLETDHESSPCK